MINEPVIIAGKAFGNPSIFLAENLLREARRQKQIPEGQIPSVCVLDPDGDILAYLLKNNMCELDPHWACYHSKLYNAHYEGLNFGIVGCAVGASYAVLLAEQMFVSGCELLISITSAGMIQAPASDSKFILIESALRDEGTSYHYLPVDAPAELNHQLKEKLSASFKGSLLMVETGKSWTTDAPYRETQPAIELAKSWGAISVEMEAAALYAYATAQNKNIVCFAHLTNTMAQEGEDFEKGIENGSTDSLGIIVHTIKNLNG
jgi:uridine phosphorylase